MDDDKGRPVAAGLSSFGRHFLAGLAGCGVFPAVYREDRWYRRGGRSCALALAGQEAGGDSLDPPGRAGLLEVADGAVRLRRGREPFLPPGDLLCHRLD